MRSTLHYRSDSGQLWWWSAVIGHTARIFDFGLETGSEQDVPRSAGAPAGGLQPGGCGHPCQHLDCPATGHKSGGCEVRRWYGSGRAEGGSSEG